MGKYIPEWLTETSDSTFKGVGEMCEGHSIDARAGTFPLVSIGGRAEGLAQTRERRPPLAQTESFFSSSLVVGAIVKTQ